MAGLSGSRCASLLGLFALILLLFSYTPAIAASNEPDMDSATPKAERSRSSRQQRRSARASKPAAGRSPIFAVKSAPERKRSLFWLPLGSILLPGLDQWWEGQTLSAATYTGVALGGLMYAGNVRRNDLTELSQQKDQSTAPEEEQNEAEDASALDAKDVARRKYALGVLLYQGAGGLSAYHAFRTAVRTHQSAGDFEFLRFEETPAELLMAPFRWHYLQRSSTLVPLGIGAVIAAYQASRDLPEAYVRDTLSSADWGFTAAYSYNAGTHEEALFRGWLMPYFFESWNSSFLANLAQSVIFAMAHLPGNPFPLPQLLLGYYLGDVTMQNDWRLGEAIFIHTWWDVLAFASSYTYRKLQDPKVAQRLPPPVFWLPSLNYSF